MVSEQLALRVIKKVGFRVVLESKGDTVVSFKILASARIVCNIVYVQVQGRIYRELCYEN
jgi:hypothetical protein